MLEFKPEYWPLFFISAAMIVAAVIDGLILKVPNKLTFPLIISGWILGMYYYFSGTYPPGTDGTSNRIMGSFLGTMVGFFLLYPIHMVGGMGAGDVKMQMGFGSWIGAYYGVQDGCWTVLLAWIIAVLVGGVIGSVMILLRADFRANLQNTREILTDLLSGASIKNISEKAAQRKSRLHLLPYGIPLCIGFITYLCFKGMGAE